MSSARAVPNLRREAHPDEPNFGKQLNPVERASIRHLYANGFTVKELEGIFGRKHRAIERAIHNVKATVTAPKRDNEDQDHELIHPTYKKKAEETQAQFRRRILSMSVDRARIRSPVSSETAFEVDESEEPGALLSTRV